MSTIQNAEIVKMKIANALVNLMFSNDYNFVSVIDIVKEAEVSRATFYRHFPK